MSLKIVTGKTQTAQITSDDDAAINVGIFGIESAVFTTGKQLKAEKVSNNRIKIYDGDFSLQGKVGRILPSTYETVTISNGRTGYKRNDILTIKYQKDGSGIESMQLSVIEGEYSQGSATDPQYTIGDMRNGDTTVLFPIYRIRLNELNVEAVEKLFNVVPIITASIPIGGCIDYFGENEPYGYKFANGQSLQKSQYPELFNIIGYIYSTTQSGSTFLLPDLRERVTVGLSSDSDTFNELGLKVGEKKHTLTITELPAHGHTIPNLWKGASTSGSLNTVEGSPVQSTGEYQVNTNAVGDGQSHNNIQPSFVCHKIIRVF